MSDNKAEDLSRLERNIDNLESQKKVFENNLSELSAALSELSSAGKAYKIIGNIMVLKDSSILSQELSEKLEVLKVRIASFDKQLSRLRSQADSLREELLKNFNDQKK